MERRDWHDRLRALLPGRVCRLCGGPGLEDMDLCAECLADFPFNTCCCARCGLPLAVPLAACGRCQRKPPAWQRAWAPFRYEWPLAALETRFKFGADLTAGQLLATAWARLPMPLEPPAALIPVPLHRSRLRRRGYNQALELAKVLARHHHLPLLARALQRQRATEPQTALDARGRQRNLRGAFAPGHLRGPWPEHVALVDDVMTTGATLEACCRVLRGLGVPRVDVWVLARAAAPHGVG